MLAWNPFAALANRSAEQMRAIIGARLAGDVMPANLVTQARRVAAGAEERLAPC